MESKIKVLLLEDNDEDIQIFTEALPQDNFEIAAIAKNIKEAITCYNNVDFDIAIIDIFIHGESDGIFFANQIKHFAKQKPFIFLTSSIDKDVFNQAKLTQPYHYLIKPYNTLELRFAIELAIEKFSHKEGAIQQKKPLCISDSFYVRDKESLVKVPIDDIFYIKVDGAYCELITAKAKYLLHTSLNTLKNELPASQFLQTHRNYVVNSKMIKSIYLQDNLIVLTGDQKITLSRRYKNIFIKSQKVIN